MRRKIEAGAQFFQSQFCFDLSRLAVFMEKFRSAGLDRRCRLLIGVGPLAAARSAIWMRHKIPGIFIPAPAARRRSHGRRGRAKQPQLTAREENT